ncbi:MAG: hypothetical protein ACKVOK_06935 [Flavobacteriales bacterium]|jgi:hypothetical protein
MMFALEKSGTSPPSSLNMDGGVNNYISSFRNISCYGSFSDETIDKYGNDNSTEPHWTSLPHARLELCDAGDGYQEYNILCNPTLLLLHIDQGTDSGGSFVPFASPRVNCRSVKRSHIEKITEAMMNTTQAVTTTEDYTVFPYQVGPIPGLKYSSVLNRDPSSFKIVGKGASILHTETVLKARQLVRFGMVVYQMLLF